MVINFSRLGSNSVWLPILLVWPFKQGGENPSLSPLALEKSGLVTQVRRGIRDKLYDCSEGDRQQCAADKRSSARQAHGIFFS